MLMSQGIAATIDDGGEGDGWGLLVSTRDYPDAMRAIRLYRLENRHWHWRQPSPVLGFLFDWKISFWGLVMVMFYWLCHTSRPDFQIAGRMDNSAVWAGEWWRIFTAVLLHADVAHLASNVSLGVVLLGLAMGRYGSGLGLLAAYLAGAAGNVAGLLIYSQSHSGVGASGMVMGGLGLLAAQSVALYRHNFVTQRYILRGIVAGIMLFVLFGLAPGTDVVAHFVGFVIGLALGGIFAWLPAGRQNSKLDLAAGFVFVGLTAATGWLAFH